MDSCSILYSASEAVFYTLLVLSELVLLARHKFRKTPVLLSSKAIENSAIEKYAVEICRAEIPPQSKSVARRFPRSRTPILLSNNNPYKSTSPNFLLASNPSTVIILVIPSLSQRVQTSRKALLSRMQGPWSFWSWQIQCVPCSFRSAAVYWLVNLGGGVGAAGSDGVAAGCAAGCAGGGGGGGGVVVVCWVNKLGQYVGSIRWANKLGQYVGLYL